MLIRFLRGLVLLAALSATGSASAATFLQLFSQPGDFVGQGAQMRFTPADGVFQPASDGSGTNVFISAASWTLSFAARSGVQLVAGEFPDARGGASASHPGMNVRGERSCGVLTGRFTVLEIGYPAGGGPADRLAIDFEQHCEGGVPALYGAIRINSEIPYGRTSAPAIPALGPSFLQIASEPGDWIGQGQQKTLSSADRQFTFNQNWKDGGTVRLDDGEGPTGWLLEFGPAAGQEFGVGTYENPELFAFATPGHPGMDVAGENHGCNSITGRYVIREWALQTETSLPRFAVDFEQRCEASTKTLYGGLRYNSSIAYSPPVMPPVATTLTPAGSTVIVVHPGESISSALKVVVRDNHGSMMPGVMVRFGSPDCGSFAGGAEVSVATDASGAATPPPWTAGSRLVQCGAFATVDSGPGMVVYFTLDIRASPPPGSPTRTVTGISPVGQGSISLSLSSASATCTFARSAFIDLGAAIPPGRIPPGGVVLPYGLIDFSVDNCNVGEGVAFTVDYPQPLPPTATYWKYGRTADNREPHWYSLPTRVEGNRMTFTIVDGDWGDDDLTANGSISDPGGVGVAGGVTQDLWWSGIEENGWGMALIQHRDIIFATMYVYDAQGQPVWYVMSSGTWNAAHTAYTGALYLPRGAPFFAYDVTRHDIGAPVGTATFTFSGVNDAVFDYTINGVSGRKIISRIPFGPADNAAKEPVGDLWWGGVTQSGWGITVLQQYSTLFSVWFTYDANGAPTWYVMPGGEWITTNNYRGKIYRAVGPPWVGQPYDVSRHQTIEVGTFNLRFSGDSAFFDYSVEGRTGTLPLSRVPF